MSLRIYNTLSRELEDFSPLQPNHVRMYVCGMTVYDFCHLGHAGSMIAFDVVQRWLKASGYQVTYVRNVTDIDKALREACRVLKPGGRFYCLEFSKVTAAPVARAYDAYSERALPWLGRVIARDAESYRYLHESIRRFPPQRELAQRMVAAGFGNVAWRNMTMGVVALHSGWRL